MRRISLANCDPGLAVVLLNRQAQADERPDDVEDIWRAFSRTAAFETLRQNLRAPLGDRARCSYCSDSRAADVEHYWPKKAYPHRAFDFQNLLLVCPECNRKKSNTFRLDTSGAPLLINPAFDDPWDSFFFAPITGLLDSRIIGVTADGTITRDPRGEETIRVFGTILNSDPLLSGRKAEWTELVHRLEQVLLSDAPLTGSQESLLARADNFGLFDFMVNREGKDHSSVRALRMASQTRWLEVQGLPRS